MLVTVGADRLRRWRRLDICVANAAMCRCRTIPTSARGSSKACWPEVMRASRKSSGSRSTRSRT